LLPGTDTATLSEECVCHEIVTVGQGHCAVLCDDDNGVMSGSIATRRRKNKPYHGIIRNVHHSPDISAIVKSLAHSEDTRKHGNGNESENG